jgi:hypothetical protein
MKHLRLEVPVAAPPGEVFAGFTDWRAQGEWMLGTHVQPVFGEAREVGGRIEAWTGLGRVGFLDTMVITEWDAPRRVVVQHTGKVVRGDGIMEVMPDSHGGSVFVWAEELVIPLGLIGRAGWPIVRPAFADGVRRSLKSFASLVESGRWRNG